MVLYSTVLSCIVRVLAVMVALRQFDSNMSGIFDRASFYDQDLYSQAAYPQLTKSQLFFKYTLLIGNIIFVVHSLK